MLGVVSSLARSVDLVEDPVNEVLMVFDDATDELATIGPVAEPYTQGFNKPAEFYGFLGSGATLAESYWATNPYASWMMVLVGDPLYRPFARAPKWAVTSVRPSPLGVR